MIKPPEQKAVTEPVIDILVGISDGLVVPFALATAVSRITINTMTVIGWTLAAIVVGSVSMALGSYFAAKEDDHDLTHEQHLMENLELEPEVVSAISEETKQGQQQWEELAAQYGLSPSFDAAKARNSAFNIGLAYAFGGLIPLIPFFFTASVQQGFKLSVISTAICLLVFGFLKGRYTSQNAINTAFIHILRGATAAVAAYVVAGLFT
ncbi:VIT1/CCC1 transporter family protein [Polluticoccus soli]|uniref:VIT1/CCC1 transporter family protein n=1 Tax=Polluticoccus soli TaxID=3034150 RepID=UPI0023E1134A|nr:VIT1/CCC1 transporter family protein [Flavipsychrobacter sp. JY13-12]